MKGDSGRRSQKAPGPCRSWERLYTIDPGEYVDNDAEKASHQDFEQKLAALPWGALESTPTDLEHTLAERPVDLGEFIVRFNREEIMRAATKYGRAVYHTVLLYRYLLGAISGRHFDRHFSPFK